MNPSAAKQQHSDTGMSDENFDLVSVLYHTLQDCETNAKYWKDAEQVGDRELSQFFSEIQKEDKRRALRAQELLAKRLRPGVREI